MYVRLAFALFIVLCSLRVIVASEPVFDHALLDEFRERAPVAWAEYVQSMSSVSGTSVVRNLKDGRVTFESKNDYSLLFPCNVKEYSEDGVWMVRCAGIGYSFFLEKERDVPSWQVVKLLFLDENKPSLTDWDGALYESSFNESLLERNIYLVQNELLQGIQLYGHAYLPSLVKLPEFSVKNIYKISIDGVDKVRVDYEFEPPDPAKYETLSVRSGSLVLDHRSWLIESGRFDVELSGVRLRYTVQCRYEANGSLVPHLKQRILATSHGGADFSSVFEFDMVIDNTISPSRFTLSHYGLPEPDFGEHSPSRNRCILLVIIGVFLVTIGVWRMYKKCRE